MTAAFALLGKLPWWVWLVLVLFLWGASGHYKVHTLTLQIAKTQAAEAQKITDAVTTALKTERARNQAIQRTLDDERIQAQKDKVAATDLATTVGGLHKRLSALSAALANGNSGSTGSGEAAQALINVLGRCTAAYERVVNAATEDHRAGATCEGWAEALKAKANTGK